MERFPFDDDYVRRLKERDPEVSEHFSTYFGALLLAKLSRRLRSRDTIEDVRQEVFIRVLMKLDELKDSSRLGAFVNSVCDYVLLETYRRLHADESRGEESDVPDPTNLEEELVAKESREMVVTVLDEMNPRDQALLRAVFFDETDKDEICRTFGVDRPYLRVLIHRALKRFAEEYCRKWGPPPDP